MVSSFKAFTYALPFFLIGGGLIWKADDKVCSLMNSRNESRKERQFQDPSIEYGMGLYIPAVVDCFKYLSEEMPEQKKLSVDEGIEMILNCPESDWGPIKSRVEISRRDKELALQIREARKKKENLTNEQTSLLKRYRLE
jgi:hypothetical protein